MKKYLFLLLVVIFGCEEDEIDPYQRNFDWAGKEESIDFLESNFPSIVTEPQSLLEIDGDVMLVNDLIVQLKSSAIFSGSSFGFVPLEGEYFKEEIVMNQEGVLEIDIPSGVYNYNEASKSFDFVSSANDLVINYLGENSEPLEIVLKQSKYEDWDYLRKQISIQSNNGTYIEYSVSWKKDDGSLTLADFVYMINSEDIRLNAEAFDHRPERDFRFYSRIDLGSTVKDEFGNDHPVVPYEYDYYTLDQRSHGSFVNGSDVDNNLVFSFFEYDHATDNMVIQLVRHNRNTREELRIGNIVNIEGQYVLQFEDESTASYPFISKLIEQVKFTYQ